MTFSHLTDAQLDNTIERVQEMIDKADELARKQARFRQSLKKLKNRKK